MDKQIYASVGDTITLDAVFEWAGLIGVATLNGWNATGGVRFQPSFDAPSGDDPIPQGMATIDAPSLDAVAGTLRVYRKVTLTAPFVGRVRFILTTPGGLESKRAPDPPREQTVLTVLP